MMDSVIFLSILNIIGIIALLWLVSPWGKQWRHNNGLA